jgi:DNA polymerase-3 subunit gamma/tau
VASVATEAAEPLASTAKASNPAMAALAAARSKKAAAPPPPPADDTLFASAPVDDTDTAQKKTEPPVELAPPEPSAAKFDWPVLVKQLQLRGVAQQLAMQSELLACTDEGGTMVVRIRVPVETLLSAGSGDKLCDALGKHLGKKIRLDTEIGATSLTAHAADVADQAEQLRVAEQTLQDDPFVQTLMREFGATIVPGSVRAV